MEKDLIKILIENRKKVVKKSEIPVRDECYLKAENKYKDLSVKERRAIGSKRRFISGVPISVYV